MSQAAKVRRSHSGAFTTRRSAEKKVEAAGGRTRSRANTGETHGVIHWPGWHRFPSAKKAMFTHLAPWGPPAFKPPRGFPPGRDASSTRARSLEFKSVWDLFFFVCHIHREQDFFFKTHGEVRVATVGKELCAKPKTASPSDNFLRAFDKMSGISRH